MTTYLFPKKDYYVKKLCRYIQEEGITFDEVSSHHHNTANTATSIMIFEQPKIPLLLENPAS